MYGYLDKDDRIIKLLEAIFDKLDSIESQLISIDVNTSNL